jgi:hypothetical protein
MGLEAKDISFYYVVDGQEILLFSIDKISKTNYYVSVNSDQSTEDRYIWDQDYLLQISYEVS